MEMATRTRKKSIAVISKKKKKQFCKWITLFAHFFAVVVETWNCFHWLSLSQCIPNLWTWQFINVSLISRQHGYRNNFRFPFCLYWLFNCLYFTRSRWPRNSPPKTLELHLGCHICWLSYFTLVCLWCRLMVGWTCTYGTYVHGLVTIITSWMHR